VSNDLSDGLRGSVDEPQGDPAVLGWAASWEESRDRRQPRERKRTRASFRGIEVVLRFKKQKACKMTHPTAIARQDVGNSTTYHLLERKHIFFKCGSQ